MKYNPDYAAIQIERLIEYHTSDPAVAALMKGMITSSHTWMAAAYNDPQFVRKVHTMAIATMAVLTTSGDDMLIEELDLSVRAYNVLKREGVNTVGHLRRLTIEQLWDMRNFGFKSVDEVRAKLGALGITLEGNDPREALDA